MTRVTKWLMRHKKHKNLRDQATGFRLGRSKVHKQIRNALIKQWQHAYIGRKLKKRQFRQLWIERLSASLRTVGLKYSLFINSLYKKNIKLNRKVLSNISVRFPDVFSKIIEESQKID